MTFPVVNAELAVPFAEWGKEHLIEVDGETVEFRQTCRKDIVMDKDGRAYNTRYKRFMKEVVEKRFGYTFVGIYKKCRLYASAWKKLSDFELEKAVEAKRILDMNYARQTSDGFPLHVDHLDDDHTNDSLDNLQWVAPWDNIAFKIKKRKVREGEMVGGAVWRGPYTPRETYIRKRINV